MIDSIGKLIVGEGVVPVLVGETGSLEERGELGARIGLGMGWRGVVVEAGVGLVEMVLGEGGEVFEAEFVLDGKDELTGGLEEFFGSGKEGEGIKIILENTNEGEVVELMRGREFFQRRSDDREVGKAAMA